MRTVKSIFCMIVGIIILGSMTTPTMADIIVPYDTSFETDSVNSMPAGWGSSLQPDTGAIQVVTGSSTGGQGANQHVLEFNGTDTGSWYTKTVFDAIENKIVVVEFKFKIADVANNEMDFAFRALGDGTGNDMGAYLRVRADTYMRIQGVSNTDIYMSNLIAGDWYQVKKTIDLTNGNYDLKVDNLDNTDLAQHVTVNDIPFLDPSVNDIGLYSIARNSGGNANFQLDDFSINVPEPGSLSLLGLGAVLVASHRYGR